MRGQSITSMLEYEATRKPEIKDLLDRVMELSDQDIQDAVVPLPWYRQALMAMRAQRQHEKDQLTILGAVVTSVNPDPKGMIGYWEEPTQFVKVTKTSDIEVKEGFPLWFPYEGGVWIDTVFCASIPDKMKRITPREEATRLEYMKVLRSRLGC